MSSNRFNPINGCYFTQGDRTFKLYCWWSGSGSRYEFVNVDDLDERGKPKSEDKIIRKTAHGEITEELLYKYMDEGTIKYHGLSKPIR